MPIPRIKFTSSTAHSHLDTTPRRQPLNIMIEWKPNQYRLIKLDLSEEKFKNDIYKAISVILHRHTGVSRNMFPFKRVIAAEYVKVILLRLEKMLLRN